MQNLYLAWAEFRRGKRHKADVAAFERHLENNLFALHDDLNSGRFRHGPYERFSVCDPKPRIIHKATVRDRIVHHAIHRVLYPVFDRSFIFDSYSCRVGKGTHAAVRRLETFVRRVSRNYRGPCFVLKFDIRRFFDSVDHGILTGILERKISCERTLALLSEIVGSYSKRSADRGGGRYTKVQAGCRSGI